MTKKHLIMVPGHSIYKPSTNNSQGLLPDDWFLESFQTEGNDHLIFIEHIKKGLDILQDSKKDSLLIFSGGQTKRKAGPKSEGYSYYQVAEELGILNEELKEDIHLEEFARDSFENVLFSIARFYEIEGVYPERITIVGFEFKRFRFLELHLKTALKWDLSNAEYVGIDPIPPYEKGSIQDKNYFKDLNNSEKRFAVDLFKTDLLGNGSKLGAKKLTRNPFKRIHGYQQSNPLLIPFFQVELDENVKVPWRQ